MSILRPPFDHISAIANVGATEDVWNRRDPERDLAAYTEDGFMRREARINDVIIPEWELTFGKSLIQRASSANHTAIDGDQ